MESVKTLDISLASTTFAATNRRNEIVSLVHRIRNLFEERFDRSWLAAVIEGLPLDPRTIREIRDFLATMDVFPDNDQKIELGIEALHRYIWTLKTHMLPHAKELLGVSPFSEPRRRMDKSQYVLRRLTADTLPHNLKHLENLVEQLVSRFKAA